MCTDHDRPVPAVVEYKQQRSSFGTVHSPLATGFKSEESHSKDIESLEMNVASKPRVGELDLNYYHLVNEVWHFCSVDWGSRCKPMDASLNRWRFWADRCWWSQDICVGYNSLCNPQPDEVTQASLADESEKRHLGDKPLGVRFWTWLIMCNDGS